MFLEGYNWEMRLRQLFLITCMCLPVSAQASLLDCLWRWALPGPRYEMRADVTLPAKDVPIIMLGLFGKTRVVKEEQTNDLNEDAKRLTKVIGHPVITYLGFDEHGLRNRDLLLIDEIRAALQSAIWRSQPGAKVAIIKLDGIDPQKLYQRYNENDKRLITNQEIHMVLRDPGIRAATRWMLNGKELTQEEVDHFLEPFNTTVQRRGWPGRYDPR